MTATSSLTVINAALTRTGSEAITSLADDVIEAQIATKNYDPLVLGIMSSYPWRWATKTATLTLLSDTPDPPWTYAYQIPVDVRHLRVVTSSGIPIDYEQQFNKLLTDSGSDATVIAKYIWAAPESYWPPEFTEFVTQRLEVMFLRAVGERYNEAEQREKSAQRAFSIAKLADSRRRAPHDPWISPTLQARSFRLVNTWPLPWPRG